MKVHFAGEGIVRDGPNDGLIRAGVRYRLQSFYDIYKRNASFSPDKINKNFRHYILDSGLFTLMFGSEKHNDIDYKFCLSWIDNYIKFIKNSGLENAHFVELDVQKKLGVKEAWDLRKILCDAIGNDRVICVYHVEDKNPDDLFKFASYVAISVPEIRLFTRDKTKRKEIIFALATQAKKMNKKVHLLGCTQADYLSLFGFCDTCDSTSWQQLSRYGKIRTEFGNVSCNAFRKSTGNTHNQNEVEFSARCALIKYTKSAGNQN